MSRLKVSKCQHQNVAQRRNKLHIVSMNPTSLNLRLSYLYAFMAMVFADGILTMDTGEKMQLIDVLK